MGVSCMREYRTNTLAISISSWLKIRTEIEILQTRQKANVAWD
jgi:hypothetical protein